MCSAGIATLVLDALMSWLCALAGMNYLEQLKRCGLVLWILQVGLQSDSRCATAPESMSNLQKSLC